MVLWGSGRSGVETGARNAELLLLDLEFADVDIEPPPRSHSCPRLVICRRGEESALVAERTAHDVTLLLDKLPADGTWMATAQRFVRDTEGQGLVVASLASLGSYRGSCQGLLSYKDFCLRKNVETAIQDMYLLAAQLWRDARPFAFLLQVADPTVAATTKRLPEVSARAGRSLQLLHSCLASEVPPGLFHSLN